MSNPVRFTADELRRAGQIALERHIEALFRPDKHAQKGKSWFVGLTKHTLGALGEFAVAKVLRVPWSGSVNTFKQGGDVGDVQVRTRSKRFHELIVRDDDPDDALFYLVKLVEQQPAPVMRVVGSIMGRDAKRPQWRRNFGGHGEAYFPPDDALTPIG